MKKKVWAEIATRVDADAILATNTSSISISELGAVVPKPARFIGMHFMNPVPVMKLVEVIRGLDDRRRHHHHPRPVPLGSARRPST